MLNISVTSLKKLGFFLDYSDDLEDGEKYEVYTYETMHDKPQLQITAEFNKTGVVTNMYAELEDVKLKGIKDYNDLSKLLTFIYG